MAQRIVIVGGAIMGSSLAWWLTELGHPPGKITVVERDPTYAECATAFSNSCIRQQFSNPLNIAVSQFGVECIRSFGALMGDARVPPIQFDTFGYLYLADTPARAEALRRAQAVQVAAGARTRLLERDALADAFPFYALDDILLGSHGQDEGYFDGTTMFEWWRRCARERGVTYLAETVTGIDTGGGRARGVTLASGDRLAADAVVNVAGTRGASVARMAGLDLPVEPRKRYTWVFEAARPLDRPLPLTIDPSGVHVRQDGALYMAGATPDDDPAVDPADFGGDWSIWEEKVWPALASRIPAFEEIRVRRSWVGHYDLNTLDRNAVVGAHRELPGFYTLNGFSGHGLQQAPAMGRGMAELLVHGRYRTLDLTPFSPDRIADGRAFAEAAVI
ncbi:NAD(P)/FAD-dependent oxidoreductase [Jannaschia marina]|uniref:NAD(P)/FAD-dependent oxidoreductase n=1 Tax=Jannaschia marina TaxID=2741674 RepID=UPI0015CD7D2C|nr:FAD-binding oxidoreductase [Jannaschia marina]